MVNLKFKEIKKNSKKSDRIKRTIENNEKGQLVRISNHIQLLGNTEYIVYQPPRGLQNDLNRSLAILVILPKFSEIPYFS